MARRSVEPGAVVVVTGASSGIGHATARAVAARGATVVAVARREPLLRALIDDCRRSAPSSSWIAGDLETRAFAEQVVAETMARHGRLDVLVNNAGISKHKQVWHLTADDVERVLRINYLAAAWTTLAALPPMLAQGGGTIVNVSSFAAKVAPPREAAYAASKAAMDLFTEGLWHDLAGSQIHAALVTVGPIDTEIWQKTDEPTAYTGRKYPPDRVANAIMTAVDRGLHQITVPRANPGMLIGRVLRLLAPAVLRATMKRFDPVPTKVVDDARRRSSQSKPGRG